MRRKIRYLLILILIVLSSVIIIYKKGLNNKEEIIDGSKNTYAIMVQKSNGEYVEQIDNNFPGENYKLNKNASYCYPDNNDEEETWSEYVLQYINKKIIYRAKKESHCKLYFDIDGTKPIVDEVILEKNNNEEEETPGYTNEQKVRLYVEWAEDDVDFYCVSKSRTTSGCEWQQLSVEEKENRYIENTEYDLGSSEEEKKIYVYLKDEAGNISEGKEAKIVYDKTPPTCQISIEGTKGDNDWYKSDVKVILSKNDALSGIKDFGLTTVASETYNATNEVEIKSDTNGITYYGYLKDKAGNKNSCSIQLKIDKTKPIIDNFYIGGSSNPSTITNRDTTIYLKWSSTDVVSYCVRTTSSSSDCTWVSATGSPVTTNYTLTTGEGKKTLYAFVKDKAGNISSVVSDEVTLSITVPSATIEAKKQGTNNIVASETWSDKKLSFTIDGSTTDSAGINDTVYYCVGQTCNPTTAITKGTAFTRDNTGTYYIRYKVKGKNDKESDVGTYTAKVDLSAPRITNFYIGGSDNPTYVASTSTTVYISWNEVESTTNSPITNYCITTESSANKCSWHNITDTNRTNKYLNNSYTLASGAGSKTLNAYIKDGAGNISAVKSDSITLDLNNPTATFTTTNNLKKANQTATLKCSDDINAVAYYFGTTEPTKASDVTTTTAADITALKSSSGLTKSVTASGTYYFACKDASGKMSSVVSKTYYNYTVNNRMLNVTGDYTEYISDRYASISTNTYIALKDTTLTLTSIYTMPSHSNADRFKGYSLGSASSTSVTPSKTNPKLSENNKTYTMWFWRNVIYIKYQVQSGETLINGQNGTYTWSKDSNNYVVRTTSSGGSSITFSAYRYGATATDLYDNNPFGHFAITKSGYVPNSGAEYACVSGCASGVSTFTQSEKTISNTDTELCNTSTGDCTIVIKVNWKSDTEKPTCTLTVNVSLGKVVFNTKTDNYRIVGFDLTKSSTATYTHVNPSDVARADLSAGTFYGYVKDQAGNTNKCSITISELGYKYEVTSTAVDTTDCTQTSGTKPTCNKTNADKGTTYTTCTFKKRTCVYMDYCCTYMTGPQGTEDDEPDYTYMTRGGYGTNNTSTITNWCKSYIKGLGYSFSNTAYNFYGLVDDGTCTRFPITSQSCSGNGWRSPNNGRCYLNYSSNRSCPSPYSQYSVAYDKKVEKCQFACPDGTTRIGSTNFCKPS